LYALVATGLARRLADVATEVSGGWLIVAVPLAVAGAALAHEAGALPLAWYGYDLERRYALSRQSVGSWLLDHLKAALLVFVLASAAALVVYQAMAWSPAWWWLLAALVMTAAVTGLATLAPVVLLPLFFRFTPLSRPALGERLERLAAQCGTKVVGVYEWALGDKSSRANAALTGLGATRRILVSDTMLADYSDDEIEVVLAHELGHHVHHDLWRAIALEAGLILLGCAVTDWVLHAVGPRVGLATPSDLAGLPLLALTAGSVSLVLTPLGLALSRRHERRADRFALQLTSNPAAFISAMKRLGAQNLAEEHPSRLVQWLFHSHPPLAERLASARAWPSTAPSSQVRV
jgi:STE24 endopeptidase